MKFENIRNLMDKEPIDVELNERELDYISMLRLDANLKKHKNNFEMSIAESNKLYRKFGIPEFSKYKDKKLLAIALVNNLAPYETLKVTYDKYNLKECEKILNAIKNAPEQEDEYFIQMKESVISLCETMHAALYN